MTDAIRILLVDGDELHLAACRMLFRNRDCYEVVGIARNGLEATELAAELQPDLILLDYQMPVMNGLDALRIIRKSGIHSKVIIYSTLDLEEESKKAGADAFLLKGGTGADLIKLVRDIRFR